MQILTKAKELGVMILETEEFKNFKQAEVNLLADEKGMKIFEDINNLQQEFSQAMQSQDSQLMEDIKDKFTAKNNEMKEYSVTKNYVESKQSMDTMIKQVNEVIINTISGKEEGDCSEGGCSSCGCGCK